MRLSVRNARGRNRAEAEQETFMMPSVDKIMRYEGGEMSFEETVEFFQELIDSGMAWRLQGQYGRSAKRLIDEGLCHYPMKGESHGARS